MNSSKRKMEFTMQEKIQYLKDFAFNLGEAAQFVPDGECGFGRECVGIQVGSNWVDYDWDDEGIDAPSNAYHKHPCLAVLGAGEGAISQLFNWCKSLEANGYDKVVIRENPTLKGVSMQTRQVMAMMGTAMTPQIIKSGA